MIGSRKFQGNHSLFTNGGSRFIEIMEASEKFKAWSPGLQDDFF